MSRDEIQRAYNKVHLDRSLTDVDKHRIEGHIEHVERHGLLYDIQVPENEAPAWEWVRPYLRKEELG